MPKINGQASPRKNSTFTTEQEVFIVEQFAILGSPKAVKTAFIRKFRTSTNVKNLYKIQAHHFKEVYDRFKKNGVATSAQVSPNSVQVRGNDRPDPDKIEMITNFFVENPMASILEASKELKIPESTIQWYLKKKIKLTPYKLSLGQALLESHKAGRLEFCQWLLEQDPEFVQGVIFGDEKWFTLTQHPNRQNTRYWAFVNPHITTDTKVQGSAKVQAFVCVVDGRTLAVIWHIADGQNLSVNTDRYCQVIDEVADVLPLRHSYWWQQDGATCHTSKKSMEKLRGIFGDRLISNKADIKWPARSPDLNPLDYAFWGMAMQKVYNDNPQTLDELMECVENFFHTLPEDVIRNSVSNILKRARLCVKNKGDHFESEL